MNFSEKLTKLRKENNLSQEELAFELCVSRQAISRWEMGTVMPDASNLLQLSKLFHVSVDYLINDEFESDNDLPYVKAKESELKKESNSMKGLYILWGLLGVTTWIGIIGIIQQNDWMVLFVLPLHFAIIIGFEAGYHKSTKYAKSSYYHRLFYRVAVWMLGIVPIYLILDIFWSLYPRAHSVFMEVVIVSVLYFVVCVLISVILKRKQD